MADIGFCELLDGLRALEEVILAGARLFVLFYASLCPFSRTFLPVFVDCAAGGGSGYVRILCDEDDEYVNKYDIEVFPTVLYFEKGKLVRRLDGKYLAGISRRALETFIGECAAGKD